MSVYSDRKYAQLYRQLLTEHVNLLCNAVTIEGLPEDCPADIAVKLLVEYGQHGIAEMGGKSWVWQIAPVAFDSFYGVNASEYICTSPAQNMTVTLDNVKVLRANVQTSPILPMIKRYVSAMVEIQKTIDANLRANRNTVFAETTKENADNIIKAMKNADSGDPIVIGYQNFVEGLHISGTEAPFHVLELQEAYTRVRDELLAQTGVLTANRLKKERTQNGELATGETESIDFLGTMVDTYNADAKRQGLPLRMKYNNTLSVIMEDKYGTESISGGYNGSGGNDGGNLTE